jgi:hypothetical protein
MVAEAPSAANSSFQVLWVIQSLEMIEVSAVLGNFRRSLQVPRETLQRVLLARCLHGWIF